MAIIHFNGAALLILKIRTTYYKHFSLAKSECIFKKGFPSSADLQVAPANFYSLNFEP